ncbi:uncharacterized protein EV420DRAFT_1502308 [Desarmillaria tabescens]|uniref:Uncharacterized protein n=1 Tax=Armillaria tabescens TaxID=1929756 RepID=A0AA39NLT2_ARMTA|nr:uncharacterized protein EV420DRAFT_1502308 [Desarmillaria tabescens]KAK0468002.1 hypothetical protein EV420DRAFT_1502308 [Desarmillaria tabescens]
MHFGLGGVFVFDDELDLQILLPPSKIPQAINLLASTYSTMSHEEIDDEKAHFVAKREAYLDYTLAFRDRPNDFARIKLSQRSTEADPSHVLLISNKIFDYSLDDTVQILFPHCPKLPFPSVPALVRLMPIHIQKWIDVGYTPQSWSFISLRLCLLEQAINFSFPKEVEEEYDNADQLPTTLKKMMSGLDERQKGWIYDLFLIEGEPGGTSSDSDDEKVWDTLFTHCSPSIAKSDSHGSHDSGISGLSGSSGKKAPITFKDDIGVAESEFLL